MEKIPNSRKSFFRGLEQMRRHYVVSECHTAAITNKVFTSLHVTLQVNNVNKHYSAMIFLNFFEKMENGDPAMAAYFKSKTQCKSKFSFFVLIKPRSASKLVTSSNVTLNNVLLKNIKKGSKKKLKKS
jgi:hypothetical protein